MKRYVSFRIRLKKKLKPELNDFLGKKKGLTLKASLISELSLVLNYALIFYKCCMKDDGFPADGQLYVVQPLQNGNVSSHCPDSAVESV